MAENGKSAIANVNLPVVQILFYKLWVQYSANWWPLPSDYQQQALPWKCPQNTLLHNHKSVLLISSVFASLTLAPCASEASWTKHWVISITWTWRHPSEFQQICTSFAGVQQWQSINTRYSNPYPHVKVWSWYSFQSRQGVCQFWQYCEWSQCDCQNIRPECVSWNGKIRGYVIHGKCDESLNSIVKWRQKACYQIDSLLPLWSEHVLPCRLSRRVMRSIAS